MKLLAYLYYILNIIIVTITVLIVCIIDNNNIPFSYYLVAFFGVCWCGINVFIYELKKKREEVRKYAKIRKRYSRYM